MAGWQKGDCRMGIAGWQNGRSERKVERAVDGSTASIATSVSISCARLSARAAPSTSYLLPSAFCLYRSFLQSLPAILQSCNSAILQFDDLLPLGNHDVAAERAHGERGAAVAERRVHRVAVEPRSRRRPVSRSRDVASPPIVIGSSDRIDPLKLLAFSSKPAGLASDEPHVARVRVDLVAPRLGDVARVFDVAAHRLGAQPLARHVGDVHVAAHRSSGRVRAPSGPSP